MRFIFRYKSNFLVPANLTWTRPFGYAPRMPRTKGHRKPPAQKKPPLTHFLCLPLVTAASKDDLEKSLQSFRNQLCPSGNGITTTMSSEAASSSSVRALPNIPPKAIRPVGALHCTLGVMSLTSEQLQEAVEYLQNLDVPLLLNETTHSSDVSNNLQAESPGQLSGTERSAPLKVDLKGLVSMHSKQSTSILYTAPEDPSGRLYPFCVAVQKRFADAGFLVEDNRELKLHATIVNTIYAKGRKLPANSAFQKSAASADGSASDASQPQEDRSQGHGPNAKAQLKINATDILEHFKDFKWAENVLLDRIAICEMGAKKIFDESGNVANESYTEVAAAPLPR